MKKPVEPTSSPCPLSYLNTGPKVVPENGILRYVCGASEEADRMDEGEFQGHGVADGDKLVAPVNVPPTMPPALGVEGQVLVFGQRPLFS